MDDTGLGKFILDKLEKMDDKLDEVKVEHAEARKSFDAHELKDEERHQDIKDMNKDLLGQMSSQNEKLTEYNYQLREHMRRTELLEQRQDKVEQKLEPLVVRQQKEQMMTKYISEKWSHRIKVLTVASLVVGMVATIIKVFVM